MQPQQVRDAGVVHISIPATCISRRTLDRGVARVRNRGDELGRALERVALHQVATARNSLASTYGPSVTTGAPSRTRTVLVLVGSASATELSRSPA